MCWIYFLWLFNTYPEEYYLHLLLVFLIPPSHHISYPIIVRVTSLGHHHCIAIYAFYLCIYCTFMVRVVIFYCYFWPCYFTILDCTTLHIPGTTLPLFILSFSFLLLLLIKHCLLIVIGIVFFLLLPTSSSFPYLYYYSSPTNPSFHLLPLNSSWLVFPLPLGSPQ